MKPVLTSISVILVATTSGIAQADDGKVAGSFMLRARAIGVIPQESSTVQTIGGDVDASNEYVPELDLTYFLTDNIAVEVIAATARHSVKDRDSALGTVDLGKVSLLPPTVLAQYHFLPKGRFSPYLGAGVNYTVFYDAETAAGGAVTSIDYDNTFGFALQAGLDYSVSGQWYVNADVKKLYLGTDVTLNGGALNAKVDLDPWVVGLGVGYRF